MEWVLANYPEFIADETIVQQRIKPGILSLKSKGNALIKRFFISDGTLLEINLNNNYLRQLNDLNKMLSDVLYLRLDYNLIERVEPHFVLSNNFRLLDLSNNILSNIKIQDMPDLELRLTDNPNDFVLECDTQLTDLRFNILQSHQMAQKKINTAILLLDYNLLVNLQFLSAKPYLNKLKSLSCSHNLIRTINDDFFASAINLEKLSKRYNKATRCNKCNWFHAYQIECPAKKLRCYFCNKIGHVQICCQAKKHKTTRINEVQEALSDDEIALLQVEAEDVEIFQVQSYEGPSISVKLNNQSCVMDYDTGKGIAIKHKNFEDLDEKSLLKLMCDVCEVGVGAVLIQKKGKEFFPIAYASRLLSSSEQRYAQIDPDALSRLPSARKIEKEAGENSEEESLINLIQSETMDVTGMSSEKLKDETDKDCILKLVWRYLNTQWLLVIESNIKPYFAQRHMIEVEAGILLMAAEHFVRVFKQRVLKHQGELNLRLQQFLISYRNTPHSTTGTSPSMAFLGRRLPTLWDRIKPNQHTFDHRAKERQKYYHDQKSRLRSFVAQNLVWYCRNRGQRWEAAEVIKRTSANLYEIRTRDGRRVRTHVDQLRKRIDRCTELAQGDRSDVDVLPEWEYSALYANLQQDETRTDLSRRSNIIRQTGDTSRSQSLTENT
ncbi:hypothetical protein GJ496_010162 [Pomphorhynchus laevis]|nr:hypothetical protein GJ496_010162 [Pomphorhynchus laevis]